MLAPTSQVLVSTVAARPRDRRLALILVILSTFGFLVAVPFARMPLPRVPAYIAAYEAALAINDLISAVLLFGQFMQIRQRALLALAAGYLFDALIVVPHALTFPGVFSATGWLGAGPQTTAWLYVFWHGGFAFFILAYALLGEIEGRAPVLILRPGIGIAWTVAGCAALGIALTLVATAGQDYLPVIIQDSDYSLLVSKGVSPTILVISFAALVILWRRRRPVVLDLWMMVVLCAWLYDVALSAVVGSSRFDLGWYAGRSYGLLAASFVLVVLLLETNGLHRRLAVANVALGNQARELEERVAERTSELRRSNETLRSEIKERKEAEARLIHAQKMEAIGNLTGGMAHDFNNLLGIIVGNLDLVCARQDADAETRELAGEALDAALRGADLTRRMLAFARQQPLQPESIAMNELVEGITKLLTRTLGENIEISLNLAADVWSTVADPAQLEAAITNLATNARDAMPRGGRLTIVTGNRQLDEDYCALHVEVTPGDYAMLEVSDTGKGMPPEVLSRIFEPFYSTKGPGKGTGLGLSMVFGFMKQSGGHINVYSEPGVGTTFRLYLPRCDKPALALAGATAGEALAHGEGERVLVVEDNPGMRRITVRQLRSLGYGVLEAEDAASALAVLERESVDLIFTDLVMPGGTTGFDIARISKARWPKIKIVLSSGFPQFNLADDPELMQTVRLLSKPYRKDALASLFREVLAA